jgi:hypothetical protein
MTDQRRLLEEHHVHSQQYLFQQPSEKNRHRRQLPPRAAPSLKKGLGERLSERSAVTPHLEAMPTHCHYFSAWKWSKRDSYSAWLQ